MEIAIDFDGTVVTHAYPDVGESIGAQGVLNELIIAGHRLILYTMRSDKGLQDAVDWFEFNSIPLYGVQWNPTQKKWTKSNKCYAPLYIDDAALGCPLKFDKEKSPRPYADWVEIKQLLIEQSIL